MWEGICGGRGHAGTWLGSEDMEVVDHLKMCLHFFWWFERGRCRYCSLSILSIVILILIFIVLVVLAVIIVAVVVGLLLLVVVSIIMEVVIQNINSNKDKLLIKSWQQTACGGPSETKSLEPRSLELGQAIGRGITI